MKWHRADKNQAALIKLFEAHGCHVHPCGTFGGGFPDLLVGWQARIALVEVKRGKGEWTPAQQKFHAIWPVFVVREDKQVLEVVTWLKTP